jgi:glyoxylase-like metal-dependent hydrolase (beta-lactamase superfamily II)
VVVHTPGHTPGHASYFHPGLRVLIGGDALGQGLNGGLIAPRRIYTEDVTAAARSIQKLAQLGPDVLCLGHGPMVYGAAGKLSKLAGSVQS